MESLALEPKFTKWNSPLPSSECLRMTLRPVPSSRSKNVSLSPKKIFGVVDVQPLVKLISFADIIQEFMNLTNRNGKKKSFQQVSQVCKHACSWASLFKSKQQTTT